MPLQGAHRNSTDTTPLRYFGGMTLAGRPRDEAIDASVLRVAQDHLASCGYEAMSLTAIAEQAGTTRQALYRRFASKADLATAAIAAMSTASERPDTDDIFADLIRELEAFRLGISRPNGMSLVGTMLQSSADPELVDAFRVRLVTPRRTRLAAILGRASAAGVFADGADIDVATTMLTGSWYAYAVAGVEPPPDWARRVANLAWRALQAAHDEVPLRRSATEH